jgi:hypothetical protein
VYSCPTTVALLPHTWSKSARSSHLNWMPFLIVFFSQFKLLTRRMPMNEIIRRS